MAAHAAARGWIPATSGNFSARLDSARCAITASGSDKTALTGAGVIEAAIAGPAHPRQSAEAALHYMIYRTRPDAGAVAHVHAMPAVLASLQAGGRSHIRLEGLELLKAFRGIKTHETALDVPLFANDQDMDALAARAAPAIAPSKGPCFGFLIAGHGLTVWGADATETLRHLDAFDYLFRLTLNLKGVPA